MVITCFNLPADYSRGNLLDLRKNVLVSRNDGVHLFGQGQPGTWQVMIVIVIKHIIDPVAKWMAGQFQNQANAQAEDHQANDQSQCCFRFGFHIHFFYRNGA